MVINKTGKKTINIRCKSGDCRLVKWELFILPHFLQAIVPMPWEGMEIQMHLKYLPYDE
jgi:hypothetical protein